MRRVLHSVAQTVGYKMGMVIGGGVLLQMAEMIGMSWPGFFVCMAGIVVSLYLYKLWCIGGAMMLERCCAIADARAGPAGLVP